MSDVSSKVVEIIVDKLGVDAAEVVPAASFPMTWARIRWTPWN